MRWNQFDNDPDRASALGDLLLGAAFAGGPLTDAKLAVVLGQVAKVLATSELPPEVTAHLRRFDPERFDLARACRLLAPEGARDCVSLMKAVALVIQSDGFVSREARAFALRLATQLGMPLSAAIAIVGPPLRPITRPRPRPVTQPYAAPHRIAHEVSR